MGWSKFGASTTGSMGGFGWKKEHKKRPEPGHSTTLYVGPKGAGKSLLCAYRARLFYEGRKRNPDGFCLCGDISCNRRWDIFCNLESPTMEQYGAWARPLDVAGQLLDMESETQHAILWIDEIPQYLNSRQSMRREVIQMINQVTLIRKKLIQLWGTGISFDWIDTRIRDQASVVYNCWTPDDGRNVHASVHQLQMGHLPPWRRFRPPTLMSWYTEPAKRYYNHRELVNAEAELEAIKTEPSFYFKDDTGEFIDMTLSECVGDFITRLLEDGIENVNHEWMAQNIGIQYNIPVSPVWLKDWLRGSGFIRQEDGSFILARSVLPSPLLEVERVNQ
jgi:hypothetical protein